MARGKNILNDDKTYIACLPNQAFDFLGYSFGRLYTKEGKAYLGTCSTKKAVRKVMQIIHEQTAVWWLATSAEDLLTLFCYSSTHSQEMEERELAFLKVLDAAVEKCTTTEEKLAVLEEVKQLRN